MSATEEETLVISETITETTKFINADEINVASLMGKRNHSSLEQEADDEDEDDKPCASKIQRKETCYAAYRRIQKPVTNSNKITAEKGLVHDYKQELLYILSTFFDENAALNLRTLSLVQLLKKSTVAEFRDFLRKQPNSMNRLFAVLAELAPNSPVISITAACFLYFMARDRKGLNISEHCIRLISILLKQDPQNAATKSDKEYAKHLNAIWNTMQDWLRYWQSKKSDRSINFDFARESLSSTSLTLEALAYIALKEQSKLFKAELLNSGCLTSIVAKLDKVILELVHSVSSKETIGSRLKTVELCYRILENAAAYDPKNQNFLIQHRNSLLIFSSAKFLNFCLKFISEAQYGGNGKKKQQQKQIDCNRVYENISLLCRVLMNVSHDNENASLKIGQIPQFLANCLLVLAQHSRYAPKEKFFDIAVMMYGMLVNLLERCAANRRKFIQLKADYLLENGEFVKDIAALELLTKLFARHDAAAKLIDEELDNDLAAEDPGDLGDGNGHERMSMSQDEVLAAIQSMMSKASIHMEDSMIASYCTLVVAILVGTDHNLAEQVRNFLPDKDLTPMLEQLERFMDFMRITNMKERTVNNIERILNSFRIASNSAD